MRVTLILINCLLISACAAPHRACTLSATRDLTTVQTLISQSEATIQRGYAIRDVESQTEIIEPCIAYTEGSSWCERTTPIILKEPVSVDLQAEQRKLRDLRVTERRLRSASQVATKTCDASHLNG